MARRTGLIASVVVCVMLFGVGYVRAETTVERIVATVDGTAITQDELYLSMAQLYPQQAQETLSRLVNERVIAKEAVARKTAATAGEVNKRKEELGITGDLLPAVKRLIETSLLAEKMIIAEKKIAVSEKEVKEFFEANKEKLGEQEQVRLRQIFLLDEKEANDVLFAVNAGADFAKMASARSRDAASRERSGDLGFFGRGMLKPEIEETVFALKQGEISPVIKGDTGFHIIRLEEKKQAKAAVLDKGVQARLQKMLLNDKIQKELPGWLDGLRKKADIRLP